MAQPVNGFSKMTPPKSDTWSDLSYQAKSVPENDYLAPARVSQLNRKPSDMSNRSEPDSLLELYKSQARNKSVPTGIENGGKRKVPNGYKRTAAENEDYWIHRDKLAQIESRELEEAGFRVPALSRSISRSHSNSLDRHDEPHELEDVLNMDAMSIPEDERERTVSPAPLEEEDFNFMDWELRTPEEVASEHHEMFTPMVKPPPRQRGSRLPVKKLSAISTNSTERDPLAPRSRNVSGNFGGSGIPEPRPRSRSVGSQNILDAEENGRPHTPLRSSVNSSEKDASPRTAKLPSKVGPTSGGRKGTSTRNVSISKPRQLSQPKSDSPPKRPGTSSGLPRPSTGHRPEGDPPWMASMYKPDPRLPPEQQMLPTHAKRLAQEQWEKEGKTGTVYDREFRLLNADPFPEPKSPTKETSQETEEDSTTTTVLSPSWPMQPSPMGSPRSQSSNRPGTSGTEHGGYKTMPTIHSSQASTQPTAPSQSMKPVRVQEPQEPAKEEKKGFCGCCVVM